MLTPYEIAVVMHYCTSVRDHPDCVRAPQAFAAAMVRLLAWQVIEVSPMPSDGCLYVLSARGRAYAEALQRVSLPVQTWVTTADDMMLVGSSSSPL